MRNVPASLCLLLAALAGCQSSREVHLVPVARDYQDLERVSVEEARAAVAEARRAGASAAAPYDYAAAEGYLATAESLRGDRRGRWDFAGLAQDHAVAARNAAQGAFDPAPARPLDSPEACQEAFDAIHADYTALDAAKAAEVAPDLFARITVALSQAEHALKGGGWRKAADPLQAASDGLAALAQRDSDGDGIPDMKDGAPWAAEDFDGFEDDDGIPDLDNDRDGIPDVVDLDPNMPETKNRWQDYDGLPDEYPQLESIVFSPGSDVLNAEARGYLRSLIHLLEAEPDIKLAVKGYADDAGTLDSNLAMAQRRAAQVERYLVKHGASKEQLVLTFYGDTNPAVQAESARRGVPNRRVDLEFE